MEKRLIVSGGDTLRVYDGLCAQPGRQIALEGAGALCAGECALYAACDQGDAIWRMDSRSLVPAGLFAGGPGMCRLLLSKDGARLYALCGDADSLLMLDARSGAPMMLARVGVAPCAMEMDEKGEVIAVAGGACGEVILFDAKSLCVLARLETCGVAFSTAIRDGKVYALSLNEDMDSVLTTFDAAGSACRLALPGLPGALAPFHNAIAAATHERLYIVSGDGAGLLGGMAAPGRACRLIEWKNGLLMIDMWSEALFIKEEGCLCWRRLAIKARDMAIVP